MMEITGGPQTCREVPGTVEAETKEAGGERMGGGESEKIKDQTKQGC